MFSRCLTQYPYGFEITLHDQIKVFVGEIDGPGNAKLKFKNIIPLLLSLQRMITYLCRFCMPALLTRMSISPIAVTTAGMALTQDSWSAISRCKTSHFLPRERISSLTSVLDRSRCRRATSFKDMNK
jgi:hypothetical protein